MDIIIIHIVFQHADFPMALFLRRICVTKIRNVVLTMVFVMTPVHQIHVTLERYVQLKILSKHAGRVSILPHAS